MDPGTIARRQAIGRLALGAGLVAAPRVLSSGWVGAAGRKPGTQAIAVGFGARDVGIALGILGALRDGGDMGGWLRAAMIGDAGDLVATLRARRSLPRVAVWGVVAMAGGSVALTAWLQRELGRRPAQPVP